MPECDYCGESLVDEDAYVQHLASEHDGELSGIDRRRVENYEPEDEGGLPLGPVILAVLLVLAGAIVVYVTVFMDGTDGPELPENGDEDVISQVETEPETSRQHVAAGTDIDYERIPPTSGPHYGGQTVSAGFYESEQSLGALVHSLEHGAVIVYYDPDQLSDRGEERLRRYSQTFTDPFQSFIAVPNPKDDPEAAYVLTAWEKRLTMEEYDEDVVRSFTAEYLGRGPERTVR